MNNLQSQSNRGAIKNTNYSSYDNPLKYPEPLYKNSTYQYPIDNMNRQNYAEEQPPAPSPRQTNSQQQNYQPASYDQQQPPPPSQQQQQYDQPNYQYQQPQQNYDPQNYQYQQPPPASQQYDQYQPPQDQQQQPPYNPQYSPRQYKKDSEIRYDMETFNKQIYKRQLDQQVAEKQSNRIYEEQERKQNELAMIPQYPFGRRTNPSYLVDQQGPNQQGGGYVPSFNNYNGYRQQNLGSSMSSFQYNGYNDNLPKLDKNRIVEKPNSLNDDLPPYDPVKESKFGNQYNPRSDYNPWGKPGAGAPLIDPDTGKKFTKYSGQLWYDTIGLTPSARDRHRKQAVSAQQVNIMEQKQEMVLENERRLQEKAAHRGRAGDVATWIQDIEGARWPLKTHLNHTNVTREKINLEYARPTNKTYQTKTYHDELGLQLEERERQTKLHKLREDVAGIEHTRHWNDWWGRPGGGAPNVDRRRHELNETLESPRFWERNVSSQAVSNSTGTSLVMNNARIAPDDASDGKLLFTKGTLRSNHKNHYENVEPMK